VTDLRQDEATGEVSLLGLRIETDDYRRTAPVRWRQPYPGHAVLALTILGALLVGFLIGTGVTAGRTEAQAQSARNAELVELINARQAHVDLQAQQLEALRSQLADVEDDLTVPAGLRTSVRRAEQQAGLTGVAGPGLRVTMDDAGASCRGEPLDCRIVDADLQLVLNALLDLGAEAVAINGERVIATTAIRAAGRAILVNYRVLSPPYVVEAVGDPNRLGRDFPTSAIARDFTAWKDVYGLGFAWETAQDLRLPAYGGSLRFRAAGVAEGAS
jgi:uncharacterized protein YlxW (UPF0749 family)